MLSPSNTEFFLHLSAHKTHLQLMREPEQSAVASDSILVNEAGGVIKVTVEKLDEIYRTVFALRDV